MQPMWYPPPCVQPPPAPRGWSAQPLRRHQPLTERTLWRRRPNRSTRRPAMPTRGGTRGRPCWRLQRPLHGSRASSSLEGEGLTALMMQGRPQGGAPRPRRCCCSGHTCKCSSSRTTQGATRGGCGPQRPASPFAHPPSERTVGTGMQKPPPRSRGSRTSSSRVGPRAAANSWRRCGGTWSAWMMRSRRWISPCGPLHRGCDATAAAAEALRGRGGCVSGSSVRVCGGGREGGGARDVVSRCCGGMPQAWGITMHGRPTPRQACMRAVIVPRAIAGLSRLGGEQCMHVDQRRGGQ